MTKRQLRQIAILEETDELDQSTEDDEAPLQPIASDTSLIQQPITLSERKRQRTATLIGPLSSATTLNPSSRPGGTLAILKVCKQVVSLRLRQTLILELQRYLRTIDDSLPIRKPTLDTPTRWNSTYWMLKNYLRLIGPITAVQSKHPTYFEGLALIAHEFGLIEKLLPILEDFTHISVVLQAEKTPTLSQAMIYLNRINSLLQDAKRDPTNQRFLELLAGLDKGLKKLNKYYSIKPSPTNIQPYWLHIYTVIVDSRFKLKPF